MKYNNKQTIFELDVKKPIPKRTDKNIEDKINKYLLNGDHCND